MIQRVTARTASVSDGNGGRKYKRRQTSKPRPREEWIAVPVPARLSRGLVDRAREMTAASKGTERSRTAREWELRGLIRCRCGWSMKTHSALRRNSTVGYYYYDCNKHGNYGREACPQKPLRAEEVED